MTDLWSSSDLHLEWQPDSGRRGIADALRLAIRSGRLAPGSAVPSTRALAEDLGVARGTITRVYADLADEGYLHTSQGAATTVTETGVPRPAQSRDQARPRSASRVPEARWNLFPGRPDLSSFPRTAWLSATRRVSAQASAAIFDYGDPGGPAVLREALARYLSRARGVLAEPDRILICGGFGHAITALGQVFGQAGIAFEDPSTPGFRRLAAHGGARITGVPVDEHGLRVSELDSPVAVVTPAHQYPLGVTLAPERRTALVRWAAKTGGLVIEDDYDGEFRFDRRPVGALQALAPQRVCYIGTVSKTLAPALRIGWLVLPRDLVDRVRAALTATGWQPSVLNALVLAEMLNSGAYDRHVRQRRAAYRQRHDRLLAALPPGFSPTGISAGLHLVLPLRGITEKDAIAALLKHSVTVDGLSRYWMSPGDHEAGLVIGYATPPEHAYTPAVEALVTALARASSRRPTSSGALAWDHGQRERDARFPGLAARPNNPGAGGTAGLRG